MKTKAEIKSELNKIAEQEGLTGVVTDSLINLLTYYLYEQQAEISDAVLESSLSTCIKMNSFIAHTMGYMYSVKRPAAKSVIINDSTPLNSSTSNPHLSDADAKTLEGKSVYSSKFKLVFDNTRTRYRLDSSKFYDNWKCYLVNDVYDITPTFYSDGGYIILPGDNIADKFYGQLAPFISEDFSYYWDETNNQRPAIFALTTTDYGVKLYYNEYCSSNLTGYNLVYMTCYEQEVTDDDLLKITFDGGAVSTKILDDNWANSNEVQDKYSRGNIGSASNPLDYNYEYPSNLYSTNPIAGMPVVLLKDYYISISDAKEEFDYYLGGRFNNNEFNNILRTFLSYTGASTVGIINEMSTSADTSAYGIPLNTPMRCLICGAKKSIDRYRSTFSAPSSGSQTPTRGEDDFTTKVCPTYQTYEWSKYGPYRQGNKCTSTDLNSGSSTYVNLMRCRLYKITLDITTIWQDPDISISDSISELEDYLTEIYVGKLLHQTGEAQGYTITTATISSAIKDSGVYVGVMSGINLGKAVYDDSGDTGSFIYNSEELVLVDNDSSNTNAQNPRHSDYYAMIDNISITINGVSKS